MPPRKLAFQCDIHCDPNDHDKGSNGLGAEDTSLVFDLFNGDHNPASELRRGQSRQRTTDVNGERIGMVKCEGLLDLPPGSRSGVIFITNKLMNPKRSTRHITYSMVSRVRHSTRLSEWGHY